MPIRPIDIISIPNRSQEASLVHHESIQRAQQAHSQLNEKFNKDVKHNSEQTVKTAKSENTEYRYDAKEKGNNSYQGKQNQGKKRTAKQEDTKPKSSNGSKFDITI
jgi:hypothetical protein